MSKSGKTPNSWFLPTGSPWSSPSYDHECECISEGTAP